MAFDSQLQYGHLNVIEPGTHGGVLTRDSVERFTEGFSKPALLRKLVPISDNLPTRAFFDQVDPAAELQWRVKSGDQAVSMRSPEGKSDYNYVTGKVGPGREFLDDIFERKLDVYSHLGTISSGYSDPYPWGKNAFNLVKEEVFRRAWFDVDGWRLTGHMFLGNSNSEFGEPARGAVGSDWHMFPTLNIFVMIAGVKKWSTRPPQRGDQFRDYELMFSSSSGRESPAGDYEADVAYVRPGDALINPPFEWHKVLNGRGFTLGGAFRVIDLQYVERLGKRTNLDADKVRALADLSPDNEELAHFMTSIAYASRDARRAQMLLNDLEYAYLRKRGAVESVNIGHQ